MFAAQNFRKRGAATTLRAVTMRMEFSARFVLSLTRKKVRAIVNARLRQGIQVNESNSRSTAIALSMAIAVGKPTSFLAQQSSRLPTLRSDHHDMWNRRDAEIERARALLSNRFMGPHDRWSLRAEFRSWQ
jgi:hypothetical protein